MFFDSYAILEIIKGNPKYEKYGGFTLITNTLNLAEVFYSLIREIKEGEVREIIEKLNLEFLDITDEIAIEAASFRYKNKQKDMSYADCIGYMLSKKNNFKFLTGDKEFENFEGVEFVKK